ncbi:hypothetical protein V493_00102 [Pseudogymnoascus sp. VKM F-4281 (FW-2241)]|nr:hypothetical protein V493_00102 [Pseudogymnoascus sp. VKM F-4281 (FW-2241)]
MLYNKANGCLVDTNNRKEVLKYVDTMLLDRTVNTGCWPIELVDAKRKRQDNPSSNDDNPSSNNDNLEADVDIGRVEGGIRLYDALCYKDVRLLVVHDPNNSVQDVLAIEVKLSHYKGHNNRLKPTIFFFTEVDDPIFYAIMTANVVDHAATNAVRD